MTGYVYFLQAGEGGPIKIGFSASSVERRLHGNQVGCPAPLTLLGVIEGDVQLERRFHVAFRSCALRGEWFKPHRRLISFIRTVARPLAAPRPEKPANLTVLQELGWEIDDRFGSRGSFAKEVGIGEAYLSQILTGARPTGRLPFELAIRIAQASGLPLEQLAAAVSQSGIRVAA
jgi:hypothetical protein